MSANDWTLVHKLLVYPKLVFIVAIGFFGTAAEYNVFEQVVETWYPSQEFADEQGYVHPSCTALREASDLRGSGATSWPAPC